MYERIDVSANTDIRLSSARYVRPVGTLVHTTSGSDSLAYLQGGIINEGRIAGATALIARDGTQYVLTPRERFAYHAGKGRLVYNSRLYQGDEISQLLLGVELENRDNDACTYQQLDSLADFIVFEGLYWQWQWPYYVLGHYETARPLGRRSDPQGFAWGDFMGRLLYHARSAGVVGL